MYDIHPESRWSFLLSPIKVIKINEAFEPTLTKQEVQPSLFPIILCIVHPQCFYLTLVQRMADFNIHITSIKGIQENGQIYEKNIY